ncbi:MULTISPECIES: DNA adenine methylase [Sellimonas]|uniref:site-specific DNA-methyltransferase (adenine-specific) n=1 Tax=Sellimonas caecigallum TaxID=2592333 RepID=A0ABS7L6V1_9FIRM|nr:MULTISPECIES: DNA adenine methylase [Sellimonas]MBY0758811.1 DNA methyltransferase [Sellimonas caecigallum]OUP01373.1 DNA methyltransferase [Drancourtella sp. An210]OUP66876.1 DNA methyltransferase [Drancourtella sp. An177]
MSKYPKVNYIGNKEKLVDWILQEMPVKTGSVMDLFAGGCSVSYALKKEGYDVISNDILYADFVLCKALIENMEGQISASVFDIEISRGIIEKEKDRLSFLAGRLYFPEEIEELARLKAISEELGGYERYLYLALLRRAMIRKLPYSRMNVPWDQIRILRDEEYSYRKYGRRRAYHNQTFESHMRENLSSYSQAVFRGRGNCIARREDAADLVKEPGRLDVVYIDPPYPSTMNNYDAFYGLFDEMFGKKKEHADFTKKQTFLFRLEELVKELRGKTGYILLSQNSRVRPVPDEMEKMLSKYGRVTRKERPHNYQVTGKINKKGSNELLFLVEL